MLTKSITSLNILILFNKKKEIKKKEKAYPLLFFIILIFL